MGNAAVVSRDDVESSEAQAVFLFTREPPVTVAHPSVVSLSPPLRFVIIILVSRQQPRCFSPSDSFFLSSFLPSFLVCTWLLLLLLLWYCSTTTVYSSAEAVEEEEEGAV